MFEVRDLWPEFPIEMGVVKNKLAIRGLRKFEVRIYKQAEHVIALSPGMKEGVMKVGTPEGKVTMVPNMSKTDVFFPHEANLEYVDLFGIDMTKFNVVYFGSLGLANGLLYIVEAAKQLKDMGDDTVRFLLLGDGATNAVLNNKISDYKLTNVYLLGRHKMSVVSEVVNCCDASIVTFLNLPVLQTNSSNKFFDSLAAGKPVIVNSAGWTKDIVEKNNCGFYVDPEKPEQLAEMLLNVKDDKKLLKTWSDNARKLALGVYNKDVLTAKVADVLERYGNK